MKFNLSMLTCVAVCYLLLSGVSACFGQMPGGYSPAKVNDSNVKASARFAVTERAKQQNANLKLISIKKAQSQVVSGRNYRLCLQIKSISHRKSVNQYANVVVYRNLRNEYSLTSWEQKKRLSACLKY